MKQAFILLSFCLLISCSSSKVTSSWTRPNVTTQFSNFLVLAMVGGDNPGLQQQMEQSVVDELRHRGYAATSFYQQNGPHALDRTNEQTAISMLSKSGADGILTIVLLDTMKEHNYVPGNVDYYPVTYYNRFWGYYGTVYDRVYNPGYYTTDTRYFWETNLYTAGNQELVYSVRTEFFEPTTTNSIADQYGRTIVKDMLRNGLIYKHK